MENSFGLLRWDLSRKPGFLGLRNLLDAVDGDSAPVPSPGGLRYGLEGAGPDVRQLLLRSADGDFSLVVWREVSVWDRFARRDIDPGPTAWTWCSASGWRLRAASTPWSPRPSGSAGPSRGGSRSPSAGGPVVLRLTK